MQPQIAFLAAVCLVVLQGVWAGYHVHEHVKVYGFKHYKPKGFYGFDKFAPKKVILVEEYFPLKHTFDFGFGGLGGHGFGHELAGFGGYGKSVAVYKDHYLGYLGEGLDFGEFRA